MTVQSLKTILSGTGNQCLGYALKLPLRAAECKTDWSVFVAVVFQSINQSILFAQNVQRHT